MEKISLSSYPNAKIFKIKKAEIDEIVFDICKDPVETPDAYYKRQAKKPTLLCNGGFFDMSNGRTCFTYMTNGNLINIDYNTLDGMGVNYDNELSSGVFNHNYRDFISGYPVFMRNGSFVDTSIASELNYNARRVILAYNDEYIFLIGVDSPGMNFIKIKSMLIALNVTDAINLDGGGSTRILYNGELQTDNTAYVRPVDNVVAIYLKQTPTIYRVQTGAFSSKANAENYQLTIHSAGYKSAYVRLVDGLYKVQVGAFSVKANAERLLKELQNKGYSAFITTK